MKQLDGSDYTELLKANSIDSNRISLSVLYAEPADKKNGMLVYADGKVGGWDPGNGEGLYCCEAGSWVKK